MASLSPISFISIFISLLVLLVGNGAFSKQAVAGPGGSSAAAALAPGMLSFFVSDSRRRQAFQGSSYATVIIEKKMELLSIILVIGSLLPFSASDHQGDASYDMKLKLNAIGSQLFDWNQNQVNPCTWKSVICDNNNNVVQVSLPGNNNTGGIYTRAVWQPLSIDKILDVLTFKTLKHKGQAWVAFEDVASAIKTLKMHSFL